MDSNGRINRASSRTGPNYKPESSPKTPAKKPLAARQASVRKSISTTFTEKLPTIFEKGASDLKNFKDATTDKVSQGLDRLSKKVNVKSINFPKTKAATLETPVTARKVSFPPEALATTKEIKFATFNMGQVKGEDVQISQNDVGFLLEFNVEVQPRIDPKFTIISSGLGTALLINSERFEINTAPKGNFGKLFVTQDANGSIGNASMNAVIVKDKETGDNLLLCFINLSETPIVSKLTEAAARKNAVWEMNVILNTVEELAKANDVQGILMGGDFNSVEEAVKEEPSPLTEVKARDYVPIHSEKEMAAAPQQLSFLSKRIYHVFFRALTLPKQQPAVSTAKIRTPEETLEDLLQQYGRSASSMSALKEDDALVSQEKNKPENLAKRISDTQAAVEEVQKQINDLKIIFGMESISLDDLQEQQKQALSLEMYQALEAMIEEKRNQLEELFKAYEKAEAKIKDLRDLLLRLNFEKMQSQIKASS